jgi:signal transduction histidine kinase
MSLDWIILITRSLFLTAVPLVAGLHGKLTSGMIYLVAVWAVFTLLISVARSGDWKPGWLESITVAVDIGVGLAAIGVSGLLGSPLWWSLLIGPLGVGLANGLSKMLITTGLGIAGSAVMSVVLGGVNFWALIPVGLYGGALILAAIIIGLPMERVRQSSHDDRWKHRTVGEIGDTDLQRTHAVFNLAAELNAYLNFERVLELSLDLCERALTEIGVDVKRLVSSLLLFDDDQLRIASAHRLGNTDLNVSLAGKNGAVAEAIDTGVPCLSHDPARDPELGRLGVMGKCNAALVLSLSSSLDVFGILLFAHPKASYFSDERTDLLEAVTRQIVVALQNAQLYQALEQENERITEIQDETRKKIARDLHDGPTQTIAAITMTINYARRLIERDPQSAADELRKVEEEARRTTREMRHMLFTLRPLILESRGLVAALYQLAEKNYETHRQNVIVEAEPGVANDMDIGKQGVLFYIAEEAINNARKHAEADTIWVRLARRGDQFALEIQDTGVGFNVGAVDANYEQRGSLGMVNMRERAELVNGDLYIKSSEGEGTCITVIVPTMEESIEKLHSSGLTN